MRRHKNLNPYHFPWARTDHISYGRYDLIHFSFIAEILESDVIQLQGLYFFFLFSFVTLREAFLPLCNRNITKEHTCKIYFYYYSMPCAFDPFPFAIDRNYLLEWSHQALWIHASGSLTDILKPIVFHIVTSQMAKTLGLWGKISQVSLHCCLFYCAIRF